MFKKLWAIASWPIRFFWRAHWLLKGLMLVIAGLAFTVGAVEVTSQTWFCNSCHIMNDYYASWQQSTHDEVNCLECHLQPGFKGFVKGKVNGLAQAVDCLVGRVGTKPNAKVEDASCLRQGCHSTEALQAEVSPLASVRFPHAKHLNQTVDGITLTCGTCHSHFQGDEHFSVNVEVCYTCHFLKGPDSEHRLVQTGCLDCHTVPQKVIERGLVRVDHAQFISYQASCEDSCHKRQIEQPAVVAETVCLNCHDSGLEPGMDSVQLHEMHGRGEAKVECFACHGPMQHGSGPVGSVAAMMDCQNCHSDTHSVQQTLFTAGAQTGAGHDDRVLSPMFLTHVACTDCHIERSGNTGGALDSMGTVARAVPRACDRCHEPGTGAKYVPFWQEKIRALHAEVQAKIRTLEKTLDETRDEQRIARVREGLSRARDLLRAIEADGSWGVHNFKYAEALLRQARKIVVELES